eukprot:gene12376-15563_t
MEHTKVDHSKHFLPAELEPLSPVAYEPRPVATRIPQSISSSNLPRPNGTGVGPSQFCPGFFPGSELPAHQSSDGYSHGSSSECLVSTLDLPANSATLPSNPSSPREAPELCAVSVGNSFNLSQSASLPQINGGVSAPEFPSDFMKGVGLSVYQNSSDTSSNWNAYVTKKKLFGQTKYKDAWEKSSDFWN